MNSVIERYERMDETSSEEEWNDDFGIIVIDVFERVIRAGETNKTVKELVDEIEVEFVKNMEVRKKYDDKRY